MERFKKVLRVGRLRASHLQRHTLTLGLLRINRYAISPTEKADKRNYP